MCVSSEQGKLSCTGKGIQFILQYLKREFVYSLNKLSICDIFIFSKKKNEYFSSHSAEFY